MVESGGAGTGTGLGWNWDRKGGISGHATSKNHLLYTL